MQTDNSVYGLLKPDMGQSLDEWCAAYHERLKEILRREFGEILKYGPYADGEFVIFTPQQYEDSHLRVAFEILDNAVADFEDEIMWCRQHKAVLDDKDTVRGERVTYAASRWHVLFLDMMARELCVDRSQIVGTAVNLFSRMFTRHMKRKHGERWITRIKQLRSLTMGYSPRSRSH